MKDRDERSIEELEEAFPALAGAAFAQARRKALEAGLSVVEAENDALYEVFPDGTRRLIDKIDPPIHIPVGTKIRIR